MCVWVYDGTFDGLFTVIYAWFKTTIKPTKIVSTQCYQGDLLYEEVYIVTDQAQAEKVSEGIINKLGKRTYELLIKAYLSEDEQIAKIIIDFLEYAFKKGPQVIEHLADPRVAPFAKRSAAVSRESHKLIGLIRFVELNSGILYAAYESTYSQLLILAPHFSQRLGNYTWVLHDKGRGMAAFYRSDAWYMAPLDTELSYETTDMEQLFQDLWKKYYKHIAIEARKNEQLRRQNMPKKYWNYLTELKEDPKGH